MQTWLPISEQFVHRHVTASRHRGVVVAREPHENLGTFPHHPLRSLGLLPVMRLQWPVEWRIITAYLLATVTRERARLLHPHHGYRLADVAGAVQRLGIRLVVSLHGHEGGRTMASENTPSLPRRSGNLYRHVRESRRLGASTAALPRRRG